MDIITGCISDVAKHFRDQITLGISYAFLHEDNFRNFEKKVESLVERRDRVQREVEAAENNGEKIHTGVNTWLIKADVTINTELQEVKNLRHIARNKYFMGLCPDFKARYQLRLKAEEDGSVVEELLRQGVFDKVSYRDILHAIVSSKGFEAFDSRKLVFTDIMEAVKDPNINIIGAYGMSGVGKTMLVKEVVRQVKEEKLFDSVVMAVVTHTPDIHEIQNKLADMLGLKFEEQSTRGRASRLCERLKKEKRVLVVLDDIWARLDPMEVGIPFGDEHHGCTVLLTSRDVNIELNNMDAPKVFQIGILKEEEAWDLFEKMSGMSVDSPELQLIVIQIAKRCAALPIAISTIAMALGKKQVFEWKNALVQLNKPSSSNFRGVPAEAYKAIELSYDLLESEELKQTFLLCSLMGHNASIQDLLKYVMGLRLFHDVSSVEKTRNRLLTVVSHLKASFLLLDGYSNRRFDMHDLICDVAVSIASKGNRVFLKRHDEVLNDWPEGDVMKSWDRMSLRFASISHLPDRLKCPNLTFLYIVSKDPTMRISNNFLVEMKTLQVLDLTKMYIPALPPSISQLASLQTLCLHQCVLGDIALIRELTNLEILSLLGSDIEILPKEIGQLVKLKLLDLSHSKLKRIPFGIFSKLSRLEELYMGNSFVQWEVEGHPSEESNASLAELSTLSCLTVLDVHIPHARIIPKDFPFEKLQRYNILIGEDWDWDGLMEYSTTLKLKLQTSIGLLNKGIKVVLKKAENLYLGEMKGVEMLLQHEGEARDFFRHLKNLHIQNGAMIQYILQHNDDVLPKIEVLQLQSLTLKGLPKLLSFCSENKASTSISSQRIAFFNQKIAFPKLEKLKLSSVGIQSIWLP